MLASMPEPAGLEPVKLGCNFDWCLSLFGKGGSGGVDQPVWLCCCGLDSALSGCGLWADVYCDDLILALFRFLANYDLGVSSCHCYHET